MKIFSEAGGAAIEAGTATSTGAVAILTDPPVRVWGGFGQIEIDGDVFDGIGAAGLVSSSSGSLGGADQGITLELSGVAPETMALFDAAGLRRARVIIWRPIFDGSATQLLDAQIFKRGVIDQLLVEDTANGTSTISAMVETAARGLGRRGGRMRTDADQRLIKATDGGFKSIAYAGEKQLYWGGKRPARAGSVLGSGGSGGDNFATRFEAQ